MENNMNDTTNNQKNEEKKSREFRKKFKAYLWGEDRIVFRETVCYFDLWEESVDDVVKRLEEDRKDFGYTKRQFVQTSFLPFECRRLYLETFADSLDEEDTNADKTIPYPDTADDLERLRQETGVSMRWWGESHLDDYQKEVYLAKYGKEIVQEDPKIKYGTKSVSCSREELLKEQEENRLIKEKNIKRQ